MVNERSRHAAKSRNASSLQFVLLPDRLCYYRGDPSNQHGESFDESGPLGRPKLKYLTLDQVSLCAVFCCPPSSVAPLRCFLRAGVSRWIPLKSLYLLSHVSNLPSPASTPLLCSSPSARSQHGRGLPSAPAAAHARPTTVRCDGIMRRRASIDVLSPSSYPPLQSVVPMST